MNTFELTDLMKRELGSFIRKERESAKYTQEELARKAGFESPNVISKIEIGKHTFPLDTLFSVATALAIPMATIGLFLDGLPEQLKRLRESSTAERDYVGRIGRR